MAEDRRPRRIGLLTSEPDRLLVGVARQCGLDFVVLDAEQTPLEPRRCAEVVQALAGSTTDVVVRVPDLTAQTLVTYANTGADELLLPQVRNVEELEAARRALSYPPIGTRPRQVSPASWYGTDFTGAPRLSVLVETVDALDRLADIARSGIVASAWFGPTDLADDLLRSRPADVERLEELIDEAVAVLRAHGVPVGLPAKDAAGARAAFARGAAECSVYWEKWLLELLGGLVDLRGETSPVAEPALAAVGAGTGSARVH
jgi:2-keto-3-deoxy-L-rhamnonate aldolase RhmA